MPSKSNSIQISKIAKEVNRKSGDIVEYLKQMGVEVGGVMSKVDENLYHNILEHFKKDNDEVENHKQKLMELNRKYKNLDIEEIEQALKNEREKKLKEEAETLHKKNTEDKFKIERESQLQKVLKVQQELKINKEREYIQQPLSLQKTNKKNKDSINPVITKEIFHQRSEFLLKTILVERLLMIKFKEKELANLIKSKSDSIRSN